MTYTKSTSGQHVEQQRRRMDSLGAVSLSLIPLRNGRCGVCGEEEYGMLGVRRRVSRDVGRRAARA